MEFLNLMGTPLACRFLTPHDAHAIVRATMSNPKQIPLMERIVALCKRRGFVFQSSEIYGGINGFWDYGPAGAQLKRNIKQALVERRGY